MSVSPRHCEPPRETNIRANKPVPERRTQLHAVADDPLDSSLDEPERDDTGRSDTSCDSVELPVSQEVQGFESLRLHRKYPGHSSVSVWLMRRADGNVAKNVATHSGDRSSGTKCLATARAGAPSRLDASPASQRRHGRCFESARLASGCGRPTNSPRSSRQRIELIPWSSPTGPCNLLMHDWAEGPIVREFSLSADWDDRWRTGGTIGEVIDEAHLAPEHILLAIKRFVAERSRRLEAMHATLDAADRR